MGDQARVSKGDARETLHGLQSDASHLLHELSSLSAKLRELGEHPEELKQAAVDALNEQMKALQDGVNRLSEDAPKVIAKVDKSVRANPYLYIFGALGLGWLLGKIMRS